ncbi:nuclease-related domain-containing protein [Metabacillus sp. Hm71]|uniref:nuclease-related domain-containing protein n=1 Tax=Metabacillus sp. Hm71 TaxID=3450743 RepID=UPI003F4292D2
MIVKERQRPILIDQLQALLRRLSVEHPKRKQILEDYNMRVSGFKGELSLNYPLSFLEEERYFILHDVRLYDGSHFFQMDTLIISKYFFLIIEVKNIAGTLIFNSEYNQLVRTMEEKEEAFPDPINQVMRHRLQLIKWLEHYNFPPIPIETLVVISNERSVIKTSNKNKFPKQVQVIPSSMIPNKVNDLEKKYNNQKINNLESVQKLLLCKHVPINHDVLKRYKIDRSELYKGVQCPYCFVIPIKRIRGKWLCVQCEKTSNNAHVNALIDYFFLVNSTICNREAREFLNVSSQDVMKRILNSMALETVGINKGRRYKLKIEVLSRLLEE